MADAAQSAPYELARRARRVLASSGSFFGALFLVALSGVASITLLYSAPSFARRGGGLEDTVLGLVTSLETPIRLTHEYGGYVLIALAGWAGIEALRFGGLLRRKRSRRGFWMMLLGPAAAVTVTISTLVLIASGVATSALLAPAASDRPAESAAESPADIRRMLERHDRRGAAERHTREHNYPLAFGTILFVIVAAGARRTSQELKEERDTDAQPGD